MLFFGLMVAPHAPHLFGVFLAKARRTQRDLFSFSLLKYIPLTPFAHAQKKATRQGGIPTIGKELFCKKWGVTLLYAVYIVGCLYDCCVVFWVDGSTPCTPRVGTRKRADSGYGMIDLIYEKMGCRENHRKRFGHY